MSCLWFFDKAHFINLSAGLVMDKHTVLYGHRLQQLFILGGGKDP